MNVNDFLKEEISTMNYIADYFPEHALTLLHGKQGSGKSYSTLKAFNDIGIEPLFIAVEDTTGLGDLKKHYLSESLLTNMINEKSIKGLDNKVVIIDTYSRLHEQLHNDGYSDLEILQLFESMIERYNITLIVIGHTRNFVGKDGIFDDNTMLARGVAEELFIEKTVYKATSKILARVEYNLHVVKGRGTGGTKIVPNWMRKPSKIKVQDDN